MADVSFFPLIAAAVLGLAVGLERNWRGFPGSAPFHVAPALVGAYLIAREPGLMALFWFLPLQILMWLVVIATVCMWAAERTPDAKGEFRGSGGLALSWTLAFLLGATCAFQAWFLAALATAALVVFGVRVPRRIAAPVTASLAAKSLATKPGEDAGRGETVGGNDALGDLEGVNGEPRRAAEAAVGGALVESPGDKLFLERPAA
jgi:hypothetical protein